MVWSDVGLSDLFDKIMQVMRRRGKVLHLCIFDFSQFFFMLVANLLLTSPVKLCLARFTRICPELTFMVWHVMSDSTGPSNVNSI